MISLKNIATIARYESKVLWRNWFFRIFALAIITILVFFNIGVFSPVGNNRWFHRAISSGIPYANMVFLNLVQVAVLIFLASGIIKNNKKLDTNEVFYVRPLSNADLVLGKALALLILFFWLNLVILVIALIVNVTATDTNINFQAYIYYPLLISFPNIIFTTSLSFLLVSVLRNQAIGIIFLLGLVGVILIYFQGNYYFLPDYIAFKLPLYASDIAGFSNLNQLVLHRTIYLCLACAFFLATISFFPRLPQRKVNRLASAILTILFLLGATGLVWVYLEKEINDKALRKTMIALNGEMAETPNIDITSCYLDLNHSENTISCGARMIVQNNQVHQLKKLFVTLNPELSVNKLIFEGRALNFTRKSHLILFETPVPILPGEKKSLEIQYEGGINEAVCYLDIHGDRYEKPRTTFMYNIDKRFVFLESDYVLLTKDALWYPQAWVGYNKTSPGAGNHNFIDFRLKVNTRENLTAISQGKVMNEAPGVYAFSPEVPLPQISLIIGDYDQKSITVDSTDFNLFFHEKNDYFSEYFDQLQDTLATLVRDLRNGYEQDQNMKYNFSRFQLVEAPVQFYAFTNLYENHQAYIQPETVLLPEKGGEIWELDFKSQFKVMNHQTRINNHVMDGKDKQANIFKNFVKSVLTKQQNSWQFSWRGGNNAEGANYAVFPNLYWYQTGINSKKWPLLNKNLADYLNQEAQVDDNMSRNWRGISFTEDCNSLMREKNLEDILSQEESFDKVSGIIKLKGDYLLKHLELQIGKEAFKSFLYQMIAEHAHQTLSYDDFRTAVLRRFQFDIEPIIDQVYSQVEQPAFIIADISDYQVRDGDRNRFQVVFRVENVEDVDGMIKVQFHYNRQSAAFAPPDMNDEASVSFIPKGQQKEIRFLLDERPDRIMINTLISRNIPSVINLPLGQFEMNQKQQPLSGEIILLNNEEVAITEIIVDNEDPGFTTFTPIREPYLRKMILKRNNENSPQKYHGEWRSSASHWRLTTGAAYYGKYVRSAHFTRSGKGEKIATWQPEIKESAYYDVYVHLTGGNSNNAFFPNRRKQQIVNYNYYVCHDDGEDGITIDINRAERGWNFLGSFYFSQGTGKVILDNKSENRSVFADAVKWVKQ